MPQQAKSSCQAQLSTHHFTHQLIQTTTTPVSLLANTPIPTSRAPPVTQIQHTNDDPHQTTDVDNPHIGTVPFDYNSQSIKTSTQRSRQEHEAADQSRKDEADRKAQAVQQKAQRAKEVTKKNSDNPVFVGNAVVAGVLAAVLGWGAYKRLQRGPVGWQEIFGWSGIAAAVGLGDYLVSSWLLQKYPPKK